jgi:hypothetical protein
MLEQLITVIGIAVFCWFSWMFVVALYRSLTGDTVPNDDDPTDHLGEV